MIIKHITGMQMLQGVRLGRSYRMAFRYLNHDVAVYAPVGLHLLLRVGRAFCLACNVFWRLARNRY